VFDQQLDRMISPDLQMGSDDQGFDQQLDRMISK
jgi:hypothetical protein